ncbi:Uncharacterised protein [Mycobacterium tuberculosis]|nr:Uncharacterised protein [Mycobacterium tuberculosis]
MAGPSSSDSVFQNSGSGVSTGWPFMETMHSVVTARRCSAWRRNGRVITLSRSGLTVFIGRRRNAQSARGNSSGVRVRSMDTEAGSLGS